MSWLITVCERVLSGDRLYVDILESNPPASVWLYMLPVWVAKLIGIRPEATVAGAFIAGALASTAATVKLASNIDDAPRPRLLSGAIGIVTLILPMGLFGEREHAALLFALPSLTALAVIAERKPLPLAAVIAAGLSAGLMTAIKPHFVLAVVFAAAWAAWRNRSIMPLIPGIAAAAAVFMAYVAAVIAFARAYFPWVQIFAHTYLKMHAPLVKVLIGPLLFPLAAFSPLLLVNRQSRCPLAVAWGLGAIGFALAAMIQAKNYPNHWLPGGALALLSTFAVLASPATAPKRRELAATVLALVAWWQGATWTYHANSELVAAIERVAPPAPTMMTLSRELTSGFPITRNVGGRWVGSREALFIAAGARDTGHGDPVAALTYREDIGVFAADVERHSPDVILVDAPDKAWLMRETEVAHAMGKYRPVDKIGNTEIWLRKTLQVPSPR